MRPEKRYIQRHVQEHRHPKRLPNVDDLQALHARIEQQAMSAEGQIALRLDESERTALQVMLYSLRARQEDLAHEIDNRLRRAEKEKFAPIGDFQRIGAVLEAMKEG